MKAKTEELLYFLLWTCEMLMRPTFRNLTDSFEAWAYRNGLHRQMCELERRNMLERGEPSNRTRHTIDRALCLSEAGRLHALGGRDPQACWRRRWDGQWRLVLFDLPNEQTPIRDRLRRYLSHNGFGYLQNSVWISPDPLNNEKAILTGSQADVESLILLEARPCGGETDEEIVAGAWNFGAINRCYAKHMKVLANRPRKGLKDQATASDFRRWATQERLSWLEAVSRDPLLPGPLLPKDYLGCDAWRQRLEAMHCAAEQMRAFKMPTEKSHVR